MAISRTPKSKTTSEDTLASPMAQVFDDVDGEDNRNNDVDEVADLKAKLAELQEQVNERNSDLPYLQAPNYQSQVAPTAPQDIDVNSIKLPDPVQFPDEYADAVERRAEIRLGNKQRKDDFENRQKSTLNSKLADLWADFGEDYPEMAANKERIDFVAQKLAVQAAQRGVDPQHYMFNTRNRFMKDVAKLYVKTFGEPDIDDDDDDIPAPRGRKVNTSTRRRASNRDREEEDSGRSAGVFGGSESGRPSGRRDVDDEHNQPGMIDEIHAMQKKSGFF